MIGIFIGIAAVVSLIGLGQGLRTAITSQFGFLGTDVLSVQASGLNFAGPPGSGAIEPLDSEIYKKIEKVNGVEAAFNRIVGSGTLEFNDVQQIGVSMSIPLGKYKKIIEGMLNLKTEQGRLLRDSDNNKVMLGHNFVYDDIFGKGVKAGSTVILNGKEFEVVGILENKGSFIFDNSVMINEDDLLDLIGDDGTTDIIAVKVFNENQIASVKENIEKLLRKERNVKLGEENFIVQSPQNILEALDSTLLAVQIFIFLISAISLVVGGIGIMNTMYTSVLERTKEIGIMKAIGARNSTIFTLFFIESGFLGMVGGLIGVTIGASLAYGFSFIGRMAFGSDLIQAEISLLLVFISLAFSFILGTMFGVLPAYQASQLQPVEALRSK